MNSPPFFLAEETVPVIKGNAPYPTQFSHMPRWLSHALWREDEEPLGGKTLIHIRHGKTFSNAANRIAWWELAKNPREKDDFQILLDIIVRLVTIHKHTWNRGPYIDPQWEAQADILWTALESAWNRSSEDLPTQIIVSPFRRTRQTLIRSVGKLLDYGNTNDLLDIGENDRLIIPWKWNKWETTIQVNKNTAEIDGYLSLSLPSKMRTMFLGQREKFMQWVRQISVHHTPPEDVSWEEILRIIEAEISYESLGEARARWRAFLDEVATSTHQHTMAFNHCDFIRQQIGYVLGESWQHDIWAAEQLEHIISPKNCSLTALAYHWDTWHLGGHNIKSNTL